jgi:hypothetical protein
VGRNKRVVQMIFNHHIDRLTEIKIVQNFMQRHDMKAKLCVKADNFSLIIYRLPYVIEIYDALIENYLEMTCSDLRSDLLLPEGSFLSCSLDLGLQNLDELRILNFELHSQNNLFLSWESLKMRYLHSNIEAIDKLLPLIEAKGGLSSMQDGTFNPRFDFKLSVSPMYYGLKEKYLNCIST